MKTAIIVNGICRNEILASASWNILPIKADWYLNTWDYTQQTYSAEMISSNEEIDKIRHLFKYIHINNYSDYWTNVINAGAINPMFRTFSLLESIRTTILSQGYERVIIFRPDLYLHKVDNLVDSDFDVSNNTVRVLGRHHPESFYEPHIRKSDDVFFVMPIDIFEKYSDLDYIFNIHNKFNIASDIHKLTFHFFDCSGCNIKILDKMRSSIVRKQAEDLYIQNGNIDFETIENIFNQVYLEKDYIGKFWYSFDKIDIVKPDMEKIRISQETGGILKLRKT